MITINEEIENINNLSDFELAQYMQDSLVSRATGGAFDNNIYTYVRGILIKKTVFEKHLPKWIKLNRTIDQFWIFIKGRFDNYADRRKFLWAEFSELLNYLESKIESPIDHTITFDEAHIHSQWEKAIERKESDPEGAITIARTLVESVLKYILDNLNVTYKESADLPILYKKVANSLSLAPEQHQEEIFKQILGGLSSTVSGLGALRNKLGDAHGKSKSNIKPQERHSELAVNLAGTMSIFLFKTFIENVKKEV